MNAPGGSARETILKRLRQSLDGPGSVFKHPVPTIEVGSTPSPVTTGNGDPKALAKQFGENLKDVLGSYEILGAPTEVADRIVAQIGVWCADNDADSEYGRELLSWAPSLLPIPGLEEQLSERGISLFVPSDLHDEAQRSRSAELPIGLTGAMAAFAGTGSMAFVPSEAASRSASLLPLHHIALVPISRVFQTIEAWIAQLRSKGQLEELFRNNGQVAFITGPSKSADIELNLTLGVHGPRDVHVILFEDTV